MFSEKKTFGQRWFWTSALSSVPTAPASSGRTCSHEPVRNPGSEIRVADCVAAAALWTCQPWRPRVSSLAEAVDVPTIGATSNAAISFTTADRDTRDLPWLYGRSPDPAQAFVRTSNEWHLSPQLSSDQAYVIRSNPSRIGRGPANSTAVASVSDGRLGAADAGLRDGQVRPRRTAPQPRPRPVATVQRLGCGRTGG